MKLEMLAAADPGGYVNQWQVHAGKPHWMDLEDAVSIPFLQMHTRDPYPSKVVWEQADITRPHLYWLAVDADNAAKGNLLRAQYAEQAVHITEVKNVKRVKVRLADEMLNLDAPVQIDALSKPVIMGMVSRTIGTLSTTLRERSDPAMIFSAEVSVDIPIP
jgi:hypothetical protein